MAHPLERLPRRYALVGTPIDRSPSPAMHNAAFRALGLAAEYVLRPAAAADLHDVRREIQDGLWQGLNITTPLKTAFAAHVACDDTAARAGAVNTLYRTVAWRGALTDVAGVREPLLAAGVSAGSGGVGLVLGAGGAARAAVLALDALGCEIWVAARRPATAERLLRDLAPRRRGRAVALNDTGAVGAAMARAGIVIQATPVGRSGDGHALPWVAAPRGVVALEMVYRPRQTLFLRDAVAAGAVAIEGWQMLLAQAAHSFTLWTAQPAPREVMQQALLSALDDSAVPGGRSAP